MSLIELQLQSLIHRLVFESTLIETLLKTCLADCSVRNIVELSKQSIIDEFMLIFFHEVIDNRNLPFVSHVFLHKLFTGFFVLDLMNNLAFNLLIKILDEVINDLSCFKVLDLQFLDVSKELSF